jgi:putative sterol carrier protein
MQALLAGNFDAKKAMADGEIEIYGDLTIVGMVGKLFSSSFQRVTPGFLSAKDYFEVVLPTMLRWKGEEATELRKRVRFRLLDRPEESWTVVLEPPEATVIPRDTGHADLVIKITSDCMQALLAGNFDAKKAIADGNMELYGDLSLLRAVGQLFAGSARP